MKSGLTRRTVLQAMGIGTGLVLSNKLLFAGEKKQEMYPRGGILRAAFPGSANNSVNVLLSTNSTINNVRARLIWDPLAEIDGGNISWRLMTSAESNHDATLWTIKLRQGVTFSNGQKLTAKDVLYSLHIYSTQSGSQNGWLKPLDISSSHIKDDYTLSLQLKRPVGTFDWLLAQAMFIFPEGTKDFTNAPGSGAFTLGAFNQDKSVLIAQHNYWDDNAGPYLDEIHLYSVEDSTARLNGLKAGQFDYSGGLTLLSARTEQKNPLIKIWQSDNSQMNSLAFSMNLSKPPFNNPDVVNALKYGIDREAMVRSVTLGMGEVANDSLGVGQTWFDSSLPVREYDPEHSKALLKKAGLTSVTAMIRTTDYQYGTLESAILLLKQARNAGFNLTLNRLPAADYYSDFTTLLNTPLQTNSYHSMPLPVSLPFYYGKDAPWSFTGPSSQELTKLVNAMQSSKMEGLREKMADLQHWLWLYGGDAIFARLPSVAGSSPRVENVKAAGFFDSPLLRDVWLA
ncbi:TPA: ABC transporter substrate-binding protein [Salmonella enterica]|uniref:ABC transporter substrate-binding protein n=1 Tax=Salmonella enterica TaxID=28901 RepID=UPI00128883B0|nr:hypothetical protein [Salmonella enterica]ECB3302059.1 hypothetical protein [Salmonella enterica subsp. enterica serovar Newport]ECE0793426.1 hypothetical protein [Salmonella enterica subsp. diarizonae]EDW2059880.1 hypothetical protein [Salmonella enterica subsp. enterica serovar Oslo]EBR4568314.1 hypothetical protein [Salmonella enterica]